MNQQFTATRFAHLAYQTKLTRTWFDKREREMANRKPFRTKRQKELARLKAYRTERGNFASSAPISFHFERKSS